MEENITKSNRGKKIWITIGIVVLVLFLMAGLFVYSKVSKMNQTDLNEDNIIINDFDNEDVEGFTNIAIFGVDSRDNELVGNTRSDTLMIASINNKTKEVKLVSVYRDTYVEIDGIGYRKLNASYSNGGPELAISTLNKHLDLDVKDFITVNFGVVVDVVNALGGIEIDIESDEISATNKNITDVNNLENTNSPHLTSSGKQLLDGTQALAYSRVRKTSGSDFRRTERQRNVMFAALTKAQSSGITTINSVLDQVLPQVYTSLSTTQILSLAKSALSYTIVEDTGFPFEKVGATVNGASVVLASDLSADVTALHEFLFGTLEYVPSATVERISGELKGF